MTELKIATLEKTGFHKLSNYSNQYVSMEDYMKVVEEKENIEKYYEQEKELRKNTEENLHRVQNHLQYKVEELKEKDENAKRYHDEKTQEIIILIQKNEQLTEMCLERGGKIKGLRKQIEKLNKSDESKEECTINQHCEIKDLRESNLHKEILIELDSKIGDLVDEYNSISCEDDDDSFINSFYVKFIEMQSKEIEELQEQIRIREEIGKEDCERLIELDSKIGDLVDEYNSISCEDDDDSFINSFYVKFIEPFEVKEEEKEQLWTLTYGYIHEHTKEERVYTQSGLLKDEFDEMYGMDSDNWIWHRLITDEQYEKIKPIDDILKGER